jgi:hypothetical protein
MLGQLPSAEIEASQYAVRMTLLLGFAASMLKLSQSVIFARVSESASLAMAAS